MKAKIRLEAQIAQGGWGARAAGSTAPGDNGDAGGGAARPAVRMGYLRAPRPGSMTRRCSGGAGVPADHGLTADGVADEATLAEVNVGPEARLKSVVVALERERWMNFDRGAGISG